MSKRTKTKSNMENPKNKIATAKSKILLIPCHDTNGGVYHWFLIVRCKHEGTKHTILIIDSLGHEAGKKGKAKSEGK